MANRTQVDGGAGPDGLRACSSAEANGCTMAKGGDGKEAKVTAPGVKVGDKMNCDDKGTCTKKLMQ